MSDCGFIGGGDIFFSEIIEIEGGHLIRLSQDYELVNHFFHIANALCHEQGHLDQAQRWNQASQKPGENSWHHPPKWLCVNMWGTFGDCALNDKPSTSGLPAWSFGPCSDDLPILDQTLRQSHCQTSNLQPLLLLCFVFCFCTWQPEGGCMCMGRLVAGFLATCSLVPFCITISRAHWVLKSGAKW